jgi:hypothetical protein
MVDVKTPRATDEQDVYASCLTWGVRLGFATLVASFVAYVTGLLPAAIPPAELPHLWGLSVREYVAATNAPTGWGWVARLDEGDTANLLGVAILAATTLACQLRVLPLFAAARERVFVLICVLQVAVLLFAASGLFLGR